MKNEPKKEEYPMRINRYVALRGYATRKDADKLIEAGKVLINGVPAVLGAKVNKADKVEVNTGRANAKYLYFAYSKPVGVVTNPEEGHESVKEIAGLPPSVFPIGRLDKASHGLLILTNDGRVTDRLLNPDYDHEKEYRVTVDKTITDEFLKQLAKGVKIEDYKTKPAKTEKAGDKSFFITLVEGKKHQIRRMCAALSYQVVDLERIRVMNIEGRDLEPGTYRPIEGEELKEFLSSLGIMISSSRA